MKGGEWDVKRGEWEVKRRSRRPARVPEDAKRLRGLPKGPPQSDRSRSRCGLPRRSRDSLLDLGPDPLRSVKSSARAGSDELHGRFMQALLLLLLVFSLVPGALEPVLGDLLEKLCHALLFATSGFLQLSLETRRETPAINLCLLHALQGSTSAPSVHFLLIPPAAPPPDPKSPPAPSFALPTPSPAPSPDPCRAHQSAPPAPVASPASR